MTKAPTSEATTTNGYTQTRGERGGEGVGPPTFTFTLPPLPVIHYDESTTTSPSSPVIVIDRAITVVEYNETIDITAGDATPTTTSRDSRHHSNNRNHHRRQNQRNNYRHHHDSNMMDDQPQ